MAKVKSVSFGPEEEYLLRYAENRGSFSEYVKQLIKQDYLNGGLTDAIKAEIKRQIKEYLKEMQLSGVEQKDDEIESKLDNILNM